MTNAECRKRFLAKKNRYQRYIYSYVLRRTQLRVKIGRTPLYKKRSIRLNKKISQWRRVLKRMEIREKMLQDLDSLICGFFYCRSLFHCGPDRATSDIRKRIFFKYGLENGLKGVELEKYIGVKTHTSNAANNRRNFTKSFETNKNNKQIWLNFLDYAREK